MQSTGGDIWPGDAKAAVTLSFDDGYAVTCEATALCLHQRHLNATYNVITDYVGATFEGLPMATWLQWREACRLNHEIGSHGAKHIALAGPLSDLRRLFRGLQVAPHQRAYMSQLVKTARVLSRYKRRVPAHFPLLSSPIRADLVGSRLDIERGAGDCFVESFVYPAGRYSATSRRAVIDAGFKSARTLDLGLNYDSCDVFTLRAISLGPGLTIDDLAFWLKRALTDRAWLIIVFHLVAARNTAGYPYFCPLSEFQHLLDLLQSRPLWIATQRQAVRYLTELVE